MKTKCANFPLFLCQEWGKVICLPLTDESVVSFLGHSVLSISLKVEYIRTEVRLAGRRAKILNSKRN